MIVGFRDRDMGGPEEHTLPPPFFYEGGVVVGGVGSVGDFLFVREEEGMDGGGRGRQGWRCAS